ncbi:unnamed protein product [Ectocarpus fasciculatus]
MGGGPAAAAAAAAAAAGGGGGSESCSSHDGGSGADAAAAAVPIPSVAGGDATAEAGRRGHRLRPTAAVRFRCLEGALRCLLDTRAVFSDAGVDIKMAAGGATGQQQQQQQQERLRRLLESVTGCLPKVMQALVRASVAMESSSSSPPPPPPAASATTAAFKSMYKRSLTATRGGGEGAQAMLAGLAVEYGAVVTT